MNPKLKLAAGYASLAVAAITGLTVGTFEGSAARRYLAQTVPALSLIYGGGRSDVPGPPAPPEQVYRSVVTKIRHDYVSTTGQVTDKALAAGSVSRMMASLDDEHSRYISPAAASALVGTLHGHTEGLGVHLDIERAIRRGSDIEDRFLRVVSATPGGPAERASLINGTRIIEMDGRYIIPFTVASDAADARASTYSHPPDNTGITAARAIDALCTGAGVPHALVVQMQKAPALVHVNVTTAAGAERIASARSIADGVLLVRLTAISNQAAHELDNELQDTSRYRNGLVVDLRQCSAAAVVSGKTADREDAVLAFAHIAGAFVPGSVAAQIERKRGRQDPVKADHNPAAIHVQIAVLIDKGTGGLAECLASTLKSAAAARLVGTQTAGKDLLDEVCILGDSGAVVFPCLRLLTADGQKLSAGISPDVVTQQNEAVQIKLALAQLRIRRGANK